MISRLSYGGEEGIRTLETLAGLHDFQSHKNLYISVLSWSVTKK